ncbi:hypothetical protein GUITHDRAFT_85702 [Guillardia theta CCMP2712]|uniref:Protein kinase domain-containing protein n=1 Tax=Guillardia theta (strain CCMP2712) TaxID=905079 RepID=L1JL60_GUITC|nr:hypothetical protein GUITHDRAFT_85702 [Guillardia theta CCMP2712]EKX49238.1 hypothetical protein GUITHDRAFT_85702 [Guillardia theta CCMP2712]|eukprot:XP_005836218.1 hypothetical protein GUITHDRAFT_85702 [Guillardia theta CCMP2712]
MQSDGETARGEDKEVNQEVNPWLSASAERSDAAGGPRVTPSKSVTISKLCDSSPNFSGSGKKLLRWRLGRLIGEGAYAQVYQGINADSGELMAVKQIFFSEVSFQDNKKKRTEAIRALQREIDVMKMLQHDNIVKYLGTETDEGRLNIFLEYVSGGSIASLIANFGALDEPVVRKYTRQILIGLEFLHSKGVVHCDIKGGNILVTEDGIIKLADFNSSKYLDSITGGGSNPLKSLLGTPQFMAPEVIRQTGHGKKADIWSVGCTVIQMLTGAPPWDEISNKVTLMFHIATAPNGPPLPDDLQEDARDFLGKTFKLDARERPHCAELLKSRFVTLLEAAGDPPTSVGAAQPQHHEIAQDEDSRRPPLL